MFLIQKYFYELKKNTLLQQCFQCKNSTKIEISFKNLRAKLIKFKVKHVCIYNFCNNPSTNYKLLSLFELLSPKEFPKISNKRERYSSEDFIFFFL